MDCNERMSSFRSSVCHASTRRPGHLVAAAPHVKSPALLLASCSRSPPLLLHSPSRRTTEPLLFSSPTTSSENSNEGENKFLRKLPLLLNIWLPAVDTGSSGLCTGGDGRVGMSFIEQQSWGLMERTDPRPLSRQRMPCPWLLSPAGV